MKNKLIILTGHAGSDTVEVFKNSLCSIFEIEFVVLKDSIIKPEELRGDLYFLYALDFYNSIHLEIFEYLDKKEVKMIATKLYKFGQSSPKIFSFISVKDVKDRLEKLK